MLLKIVSLSPHNWSWLKPDYWSTITAVQKIGWVIWPSSNQEIHQSVKTKRGRREGDGKKNVTTICDKRHDNLRHFMTTCDILWQFPSLSSIDIKRHKSSLVVISRHKMSRQFATKVTTIYDIFCPVPFLLSPFGFRRIKDFCESKVRKLK